MKTSHGLWKPEKHLLLINEYVLKAAAREKGYRKLMFFVPPRHGKSTYNSQYLAAWWTGRFPDEGVILTSYEGEYAHYWGGKARETATEFNKEIFGTTLRDDSQSKGWWRVKGHEGGMVSVGIGGAITGKGASLLIVDDVIKNSEQARSRVIREKNWEWYNTTALTRLDAHNAVIIMLMTRWHEDDLPGRILREAGEGWTVVALPAIAEKDEYWLDGSPFRSKGEPLLPDRFPLSYLEEVKRNLRSYWWNALYQQRPTAEEGNMFRRPWFEIVQAAPYAAERVRYWDKAGTSDGGNYSAGILMAKHGGTFYIEDLIMGQWSSHERNQVMCQTAMMDAQRYANEVGIWVEQEPGSGGKESAEITVQMLAGYPVFIDVVTGSKEVRAEPLSAQAQAGNVKLVAAPWNGQFIDIMAEFPNGSIDDPVDAASGAFIHLALGTRTYEEIVTYRSPIHREEGGTPW